MESLGHYHPAIVHGPIAMIIMSVLFELIGLATDVAWWRKAAFTMLVLGVLGAGLAVLSGRSAEEAAAHDQGVPEEPIERHEEAATWTLIVGAAAVLTRAAAARAGGARSLVAVIAFALHVATGVLVGVTGDRGGDLVFEHAAGVRLHGELLRSGPPRGPGMHETAKAETVTSGATTP